MVKSRFKSALCVLLSMMVIFCQFFALTVSAAEEEENQIMPRLSVISSTSTTFSISGITATCKARLFTSSSASLSIKMELQKYSSGSYSTVQTWSVSGSGTSLTDSRTKTINVLYDYRLKVTYKAGSETSVTYKYPS